jgi:hypothetical protein
MATSSGTRLEVKRSLPRPSLRVLFPTAALGLSLLVVELLLRLASISYPAFDRPTTGLREWGVPHAEGWATGETSTWVTLNAEGARDRDHPVAKPPNTIRIIVVGDSYAAAFQVDMEDAFWAVAERELESCSALDGRTVEMINISKSGYGTAEELLALRRFGWKYDPDWVVLAFLTGNDFRNNSRALKSSDRPYFVLEEGSNDLRLDESYAEQKSFERWAGWQGDLWYGSVRASRILQLARHLRRQIKVRIEFAETAAARAEREATNEGAELGLDEAVYLEPLDPDWQSAWRTTEAVIRLMRSETQDAGAEFLLMTLSNAIQVNPDATLREAYAERIGTSDLFWPDRRLRALGEAANFPVVTLAPILRDWAEEQGKCVHGFEDPWTCKGHWNQSGHRVAGAQLAARLCEEITANHP